MRTLAGIIGFLFLLGLLIQIVKALLVIAAVVACLAAVVGALYLLAVGLQKLVDRHRRAVQARLDEKLALIYRATEQHQLYLSGDPRGIYGAYPPAI